MPPVIPLVIALVPTITAAATAAGGAAAAAGAGAGIAAASVAGLTALGSAVTAGVATGTTAAIIGGVTLAGSVAGTVAAGFQTFSKPKTPELDQGISTAAFSARQAAIDRQRLAFGSSSTRMVRQGAPAPRLGTSQPLGPVAVAQ